MEIKGTLKAFLVRNPHSFVHVEEEALKDKDENGVASGTLQVGYPVVFTGSPGRNPEDHRLRMRSITRPADGWKWPVGNRTFN